MPAPHISPQDGTDVFSYDVGGGALGVRFDSVGRRRNGTTAAPAVATGAGLGTGSPAAAMVAGSTDEFGAVNLTAGTSPVAGTLCTITPAVNFATAPLVVVTPQDANSAGADLYVTTTTSSIVIKAAVAITGNTKITYHAVTGA